MGMNMFMMYSVLAGFFWIGAELIIAYKGAIDPKDVYVCIFVLMLASLNSAGAGANAPDMGRAEASVDKVFDIFDYPSPIDAIKDDTDKDKKTLFLSISYSCFNKPAKFFL